MNINFDKNSIALFGKAYKLDVLLRKYAILSGNQIYHFLSNRRIQIPRALNVMAITAVLNKKILLLNTNDLEVSEFNRLQYYQFFTEEQLFRLVKRLGITSEEFEEYRMNIFKLIVENSEALDLSDGEFSYLKNLKKQPIESFEEYFNFVSGASLESSNTFDGVDLDVLEKYFPITATDDDIQDICDKYGIDIPLTLEQGDLLDYVSNYLNKTNKASRTVMNELSRMNLEQLETYCERMDIPMHSNMNTSQRARYLLYYLSLCDISKTVVDNIVADDSYYPIEFNIDYNKINKGIEGSCIIFNHNEDIIETIEEENDVEYSSSNENDLDNDNSTIDNCNVDGNENNDEALKEISNNDSFDPIIDDNTVENVIAEDNQEENDSNLDNDNVLENEESSNIAFNQEESDSNLDNEKAKEEIPFENIPNPFLANDEEVSEEDNQAIEEINDVKEIEALNEDNIERTNNLEKNNNKADDDFDPFTDIDSVNIDDDTEALIDSILDTKEEKLENITVLDESLNDVKVNEAFGDKKLLKLTQGNGGLITFICVLIVFLIIIGFILWAFFFR